MNYFTQPISIITRDKLWAHGNVATGAHYDALRMNLSPFASYNLQSAGYPWQGTSWQYPPTELNETESVTIGTGEGIVGAATIFRWVKCFRVRVRIEWMWTSTYTTDAGIEDNDVKTRIPNATLYYANVQRSTGFGRQNNFQLGEMLNMNVPAAITWPDRQLASAATMTRPYANLFDQGGLKRLRFSPESNVRWITWRPWSNISKMYSTWRTDQVAQSWNEQQLGQVPIWETGLAVGGIAFYSDMNKMLQRSGDLAEIQNTFKMTFYFDYKLYGRQ